MAVCHNLKLVGSSWVTEQNVPYLILICELQSVSSKGIHLLQFLIGLFVSTEAVTNIIGFLGMQPCERSDKVTEGKSSHTLCLAGVFRGGHDALVRAKLVLQDTVTMQITVRSTDPVISEIISCAVG